MAQCYEYIPTKNRSNEIYSHPNDCKQTLRMEGSGKNTQLNNLIVFHLPECTGIRVVKVATTVEASEHSTVRMK